MTLETRLFKTKDIYAVHYMDSLSGFNMASYIDNDNDWAWGLFDNSNQLIGYCSIGYADDCNDAISKHPMHDNDSLLLDNVFILPKYRHTNNAIRMISDAITNRWHYDNFKAPVFLSYVSPTIIPTYELVGFKQIENSNSMILYP